MSDLTHLDQAINIVKELIVDLERSKSVHFNNRINDLADGLLHSTEWAWVGPENCREWKKIELPGIQAEEIEGWHGEKRRVLATWRVHEYVSNTTHGVAWKVPA